MDEIRARLAKLDACAVSDALDQCGIRPSVTGLAPLSVRRRISGRIVTVKLSAGSPPPGPHARHLCTAAIDRAQAGDVVVIEQLTGIDCAGWGGILSNAAAHKRLAGVIIEGPARDIDESAEIGFPVYARCATARTARGRVHESETGGPVQVGGDAVHEGDWVVADASGAAFIPAARINEVLEAAERIAAKEAGMTKAVLAGHRVSDVMGADYERLLEKKPGA